MLKQKGKYDNIINSITKDNIPKAWTYDMTSTLPILLIAYLEKWLEEAERMIVIEDKYRQKINNIINNLKEYLEMDSSESTSMEEYNKSKELIEETLKELGSILTYLWW